MKRTPLKAAMKLLQADLAPVTPAVGSVVTMDVPALFPLSPPRYVGAVDYRECLPPPVRMPMAQIAEELARIAQGRPGRLAGQARVFVRNDPARLLLWACGRHEVSAEDLVIEDAAGVFMVMGEVTIGIDDQNFICGNDVISHDGTANERVRALFQPATRRNRSPLANALYQRARLLGRQDAMDLIAAVCHYSNHRMSVLMPDATNRRVGGREIRSFDNCDRAFEALLGVVRNHPDPVAKLYCALVPDFLDEERFALRFGRLDKRPGSPDTRARNKIERDLAVALGIYSK